MTPLLDLRGLCKRFAALVVIDDLTVSLAAGEVLGVVGPNGAGKSTLFNLIDGQLRPDAGQVLLQGIDITRLSSPKRCIAGIGRTYQVPQPFVGMTAFENVLVGATHGQRAGRRAAYEASVEALRTAGILERANVLAGDLGLLDLKRLELARALATGPRLLLLDEVAGGLTEPEVRDLVETIRGLRARGIAVIWIEHIVHALLSIVDRLLCLTSGRVLMEGDPAAVMASPQVQDVYLGSVVDETVIKESVPRTPTLPSSFGGGSKESVPRTERGGETR